MKHVRRDVYGQFGEIGWGDADDHAEGGNRVRRATASALLVGVAATYWGVVWVLTGLAPLAYLASHVPMRRRQRSK